MYDNLNIFSSRGEWYERGVNYGILDCLFHSTTNGPAIYKLYNTIYHDECRRFEISNTEAAIEEYKQKTPEDSLSDTDLKDLYHKYFLCGRDMMNSYLAGISGKPEKCLSSYDSNSDSFEIVYLQLGLYQPYGKQNDIWVRNAQVRLFKQQFADAGISVSMDSNAIIQEYCKKGRLFNADTLVLLRDAEDTEDPDYYLLVADEGNFASDTFTNTKTETDVINQLMTALARQRMQSFFRNASIYSQAEYSGADFEKAGALAADKPLWKTLQAAAYATSFIDLLVQSHHLRIENDNKNGLRKYINLANLTVVGMTNVYPSVINLRTPTVEAIDALRQMGMVYRENESNANEDKLQQQKEELEKYVSKKFQKAEYDEDDWSIYHKTLSGFENENNDLRRKHGQAFMEALKDPDIRKIYACGAPGIGKTYSVIQYAKNQPSGIFGYQAPRTILVNEFSRKIIKADDGGCQKDILSYATNSTMGDGVVAAHGDPATIEKAQQIVNGVITFKENADEKVEYKADSKWDPYDSRHANAQYNAKNEKVMERLCRCSSMLEQAGEEERQHLIPKLAPAFSTQSFGSCSPTDGNKYLNLMFGISSADPQEKKVQVEKLTKTYKNILWMIDETSGDEHGMQISNAAARTLRELHKINHNINTKFIMADASLQDEKITKIYSNGKIGETFFISKPDHIQQGVYTVKQGKATAVLQCNAYPAKDLKITYKIAQKLTSKADVKTKIEQDIWKWYQHRDKKLLVSAEDGLPRKPQYILFLQNRQDIKEIMEYCDGMGIPCVKITSDTDVKTKAKTEQEVNSPNGPAVILMTSSGARGISCKYVTTIACFVPTFQVPSNLMEILQAIYRGRGDDRIDREETKHLVFYVDLTQKGKDIRLKCDDQDRVCQLKKRQLKNHVDAMTMMSLIEGAVETRIYGADLQIGYAITPLGRQSNKRNDRLYFDELEDHIKRLENTGIKEIEELCKYARACAGYEVSFDKPQQFIDICNSIDREDQALRDFAQGKQTQYPKIPSFIISNQCIIFRTFNTQISQTQSVDNTIFKRCQSGSAFVKSCEEALKKNTKMGIGKNEETAYKAVLAFVQEKSRKFEDDFLAIDNHLRYQDTYIAIPLAALGKKWENGTWCDKDSDWDCTELMYQLLRMTFDINIHLPRDSKNGYATVPYLCFTSGNIKQKAVERFVNTELITSNSVNMLSLLFSE